MIYTSTSSPWIHYWQRKQKARIRLFCFPYAGGGASIFHAWSEHLPPEIEVCPVQLPGREQRFQEQAIAHIQPLIASLANALYPYLDMPYAFFGHSMGSLISFELARYLSEGALGSRLLHLFVSGHRAPHIPDADPPIYHLPDEEFIEEIRKLKGTSEEVLQNHELLTLFMPLLRADFTLCETYAYTHGKPLRCPITAFGGLCDTEAPKETIPAWKEHTSSVFTARFFPGDHFFLHKEQLLLLQYITQDIFHAAR